MIHSQNFKCRRPNSGFTLVELLVVIAIVGVISSVVLVSLSTARLRANNTAIKANLAMIRGQALVYYSDNGFVYMQGNSSLNCGQSSSMYQDSRISEAIIKVIALQGGVSPLCKTNKSSWVIISAPLPISEGSVVRWCVDDTGVSRGITASQYTTFTLNTPQYWCP